MFHRHPEARRRRRISIYANLSHFEILRRASPTQDDGLQSAGCRQRWLAWPSRAMVASRDGYRDNLGVTSSIARGLALFLGVFSLVGLAGSGGDANLWWIDFYPLPTFIRVALLIAFAVAMIAMVTRRRTW